MDETSQQNNPYGRLPQSSKLLRIHQGDWANLEESEFEEQINGECKKLTNWTQVKDIIELIDSKKASGYDITTSQVLQVLSTLLPIVPKVFKKLFLFEIL